jgi:hypothetical protein
MRALVREAIGVRHNGFTSGVGNRASRLSSKFEVTIHRHYKYLQLACCLRICRLVS